MFVSREELKGRCPADNQKGSLPMKIARFLLAAMALGLSSNSWSLSLLDVFQETMASDPRLIKSEAETAISQSKERYSLGGLLPQAQLGAQGNRTGRDSDAVDRTYYNGEKYYFNLSQPLFNKSAWEGYRSSVKESRVSQERLRDIRNLVAVDVVDRYTRVLAAEDNYEFVVAEREAAEQQYKQVKASYERQLAKITDLLSVEARLNVLLSKELDAKNEVLLAREFISELLGREVAEPFAKLNEDVTVSVDLGDAEDWVRKGLSNNPGLVSSRNAIAAARSRVKEAEGRHYPTVNARITAQESDIGYEGAQNPKTETYVAALELSIPIYSGGQVNAQVDEARARLRIAETEYQQKKRATQKEIRQSYLNARSAQLRVSATRKAFMSSQKSYDAQKAGLRYGTVTVVDVLDALEVLFESRRDYRQAYYSLILETVTLHQVSGEFTSDTILNFDNWLLHGQS